jgi:hypothetical protein
MQHPARPGRASRRTRRHAANRPARRDARHLQGSRGPRDRPRRGQARLMTQTSDAPCRSAVPDCQRVAASPRRRPPGIWPNGSACRSARSTATSAIHPRRHVDRRRSGRRLSHPPGDDLPPLMFDRDEIQALVFGARIVRQFGHPALARASDAILGKIAAIVPKDLAPLVAETRLLPSTIGGGRSADALTLARRSSRRPTRTPMARPRPAPSARWGSSSGAGRGPLPRGANCGRISGTSGSIARRRPRCSRTRSRTRREKGLRDMLVRTRSDPAARQLTPAGSVPGHDRQNWSLATI